MSKIESTKSEEASVVYVEPGTARWARKSRTASPPRAGMSAFTPTAERYDA